MNEKGRKKKTRGKKTPPLSTSSKEKSATKEREDDDNLQGIDIDSGSILEAIKELLKDLCTIFKNLKVSDINSLHMFNRLVKGLTETNTIGTQRVIESFNKFFLLYDPNQDDIFYELPEGAKIEYNQKIFVKIQRFIYASEEENKDAIVSHLLYISSLLIPSEETEKKVRKNIQKSSESTPEGKFIKNIMQSTESVMGDMEKGEVDNPATVIAKLASSGTLNQMVKGIKEGVDNGQMDPQRILNVLHNTADNFFVTAKSTIKKDPPPSPVEESEEEQLENKIEQLDLVD